MAVMRKVVLKVVDSKGQPVSVSVLEEIKEEYKHFADHGSLTEAMQARVKSRGDVLDYRKTLIAQVSRGDPERGMDYADIKAVIPILDALEAADSGGAVYLSEADFKIVCDKIQKRYLVVFNRNFANYIQSVLDSESVSMVENGSEE